MVYMRQWDTTRHLSRPSHLSTKKRCDLYPGILGFKLGYTDRVGQPLPRIFVVANEGLGWDSLLVNVILLVVTIASWAGGTTQVEPWFSTCGNSGLWISLEKVVVDLYGIKAQTPLVWIGEVATVGAYHDFVCIWHYRVDTNLQINDHDLILLTFMNSYEFILVGM